MLDKRHLSTIPGSRVVARKMELQGSRPQQVVMADSRWPVNGVTSSEQVRPTVELLNTEREWLVEGQLDSYLKPRSCQALDPKGMHLEDLNVERLDKC